MKRFLLSLVAFVSLSVSAEAATCFWVGGTGTWDNSTDAAKWSSSSGGSGSTCAATGGVPKNAGDIATFDGSSGGGTVTNNVDINIAQITIGAFTGTLDFATNNKNVTLSTAMSLTGAGTKTLNMGSGTWTLTATTGTVWDCGTCTNLTLNAGTSTIDINATPVAQRGFGGGSKTYSTVKFTCGGAPNLVNRFTGGNNTVSTLAVVGCQYLEFAGGYTTTVTTVNLPAGLSSGTTMYFGSDNSATNATLSTASALSFSWLFIQGLTKAGAGSITATNSFDGGGNSGVTITPPAGGGRIISG